MIAGGSIAWQRPVRVVGTLAGMVFALAVLDLAVGGHLAGRTTFHALPGSRLAVSGNLAQSVRHPDAIRLRIDPPGPVLTVAEVKGRFWRGELQVPTAAAGVYTLHAAGDAAQPVWRVVVHPREAALRAASPFFLCRHAGIAPWWFAMGSAPLLLAGLYLSFRIAGTREAALAAQGFLPIVKLARRKDHWEIAAPMQGESTPAVGQHLAVLTRRREPVARMTVTGVDGGLVVGRSHLDAAVRPNGYVQLPADGADADAAPGRS